MAPAGFLRKSSNTRSPASPYTRAMAFKCITDNARLSNRYWYFPVEDEDEDEEEEAAAVSGDEVSSSRMLWAMGSKARMVDRLASITMSIS